LRIGSRTREVCSAVAAGADLIETGNFDCFMPNAGLSAEEVLLMLIIKRDRYFLISLYLLLCSQP